MTGRGLQVHPATQGLELSQKDKFLAVAKQFEVDETGETFDRTFKAIATHNGLHPV